MGDDGMGKKQMNNPKNADIAADTNAEDRITLRSLFITILTGFLIGIGSIAPGISGGAIAVVFGLYSKITDAIAHFYRHFWQKMKFLIPLGIGGILGILLFGRVIGFLFDNYNMQIRCLFIGLMVGTLPSVFRTANKQGFKGWYLLPMLLAAGMTALFAFLDTLSYTGGDTGLTWPLLFISGAVVGFGMIVPGVSSSFILMACGLYEPLLRIFNQMDIVKLIPVGIGFGLFILLFAKLVDWLYRKAYGFVSYIVAGLLIGSIFPVIPPLQMDVTSSLALLLAVLGCLLSWGLLLLKKDEM